MSFAAPGSTYELGVAIAQLRHAYKQIVNGEVRDWQSFAKGLLAPQIERLERFHQTLVPTETPEPDLFAIVNQGVARPNSGVQSAYARGVRAAADVIADGQPDEGYAATVTRALHARVLALVIHEGAEALVGGESDEA